MHCGPASCFSIYNLQFSICNLQFLLRSFRFEAFMRDEDLIPVREPRPTWLDRLYLPRILAGLWTTFRHLFHRRQTIRYPEQRRAAYVPRYRGLHRLNRDEAGRVKCVACFMCPTIFGFFDRQPDVPVGGRPGQQGQRPADAAAGTGDAGTGD
jgi:hypothetical protein